MQRYDTACSHLCSHLQVVYGHMDDAEWNEVHADDWSLRPALGSFAPCVTVRLNEEGIVAAYSRNNTPVPQRVVMLDAEPSVHTPLYSHRSSHVCR